MKTYLIYRDKMLWATIEGSVEFRANSIKHLVEEASKGFFAVWGGCAHMMDEDDLIHWLKKEFKLDVEVVW